MSTSAARQFRSYHRHKAGKRVYSIEADECGLEELLRVANLLPPNVDDHAVVEAALARLVELLVQDHRQAVGQS